MESTSSAIGLLVIVALYITIGVMSAAGSVYIAKSVFGAKVEQVFFGLFLIPIAGFYLAFTAHFGDKDAWQLEATAVAVFAVFGLVGVRVPFALIVGYLLHGLWDAVHEFNAHAGGSLLGPWQTTPVPLRDRLRSADLKKTALCRNSARFFRVELGKEFALSPAPLVVLLDRDEA